MVQVLIVGSDGREVVVTAHKGQSLMEVIRDNGFDELEALCGGSCSCATCHVFVSTEWVSRIGAQSVNEDEMLDSLDNREPNSRLSCQIQIDDDTDGLKVAIAPSH